MTLWQKRRNVCSSHRKFPFLSQSVPLTLQPPSTVLGNFLGHLHTHTFLKPSHSSTNLVFIFYWIFWIFGWITHRIYSVIWHLIIWLYLALFPLLSLHVCMLRSPWSHTWGSGSCLYFCPVHTKFQTQFSAFPNSRAPPAHICFLFSK